MVRRPCVLAQCQEIAWRIVERDPLVAGCGGNVNQFVVVLTIWMTGMGRDQQSLRSMAHFLPDSYI